MDPFDYDKAPPPARPDRGRTGQGGMQQFSFTVPTSTGGRPQGQGSQGHSRQRAPGQNTARRPASGGQHARPQNRTGAARPPQHAARAPQADDRRAYVRAAQQRTRRPSQPGARRPADYPVCRKKRRRNPLGGAGFFVAAFALILVLAGVITYVLQAPQRAAAASSAAAASAAAQAAEEQKLAETLAVAGDKVGPVYQAQPVLTPFSAGLYALPENGRVDMSYFDDALLIGDSLTTGFEFYSTSLSNAKYAAYVGAGPQTFTEGTVTDENNQTVQPMDVIVQAQPKKVYIMLGTNSIETMKDEGFLKYYGEFLDLLQQKLPQGTIYYIESILPVSAAKMESDENFTVERIQNLNEQLARLAADRGMHYLDLYSTFADGTGAMRAEYGAADGLHLNDTGYGQWREYLVTHTVYSPQNPYLPGSPCYVAPAAQ